MSSIQPAAALMRLTPRDRALVEVLSELRYLTTGQVQQVCYPTISVRSVSHRLGVLRRRGVLACLSHRTFDDRRGFWGLTPLGRAAAAALAGARPERPGTSAVAALLVDHLIATNQVFCDLCREHRDGRLGPFRWLGSHRAHLDLGQTCLVPDAVILVLSPEGGAWMYCLELDRGTMPREALAEKFERYRLMRRVAAAHREDPVWETWGASWLLFACADRERAAVAARLAAACGLERVWAGAAAECAACLAAAVGPGAGAATAAGAVRPEVPAGGCPAHLSDGGSVGLRPPDPGALSPACPGPPRSARSAVRVRRFTGSGAGTARSHPAGPDGESGLPVPAEEAGREEGPR